MKKCILLVLFAMQGILGPKESNAMKNKMLKTVLETVQINDSYKFEIYLQLSHIYFRENWSQDFDPSYEVFRTKYEKELRSRVDQGNRFLFLFRDETDYVGIANLYDDTDHESQEGITYIAEFYLVDSARGKGIASEIMDQIKHLVFTYHKKTRIRCEVDKDLPVANKFWSANGFKLIKDNPRNLYEFCIDEISGRNLPQESRKSKLHCVSEQRNKHSFQFLRRSLYNSSMHVASWKTLHG